jgi:DNA-binding protein H-NS
MPKGSFIPKPVVGPNGETWKGRGRKPKWLLALEAAKVSSVQAAPVPQAQIAE